MHRLRFRFRLTNSAVGLLCYRSYRITLQILYFPPFNFIECMPFPFGVTQSTTLSGGAAIQLALGAFRWPKEQSEKYAASAEFFCPPFQQGQPAPSLSLSTHRPGYQLLARALHAGPDWLIRSRTRGTNTQPNGGGKNVKKVKS